MTALFSFSKEERITCPQDFRKGMKSGKRLYSKNLTVYTLKKREAPPRLGVIVKKEVGPATYRNRIKRYCREFFRLHKHKINGSLDVIVYVKKGCSIHRYQEAEEELTKLLSPGSP